MHIRTATTSDVEGIRNVGVAAWHDTYPGMVPEGYIAWSLDSWWTAEAIARQVDSPQFIVLVAELEGQVVGIAHTQVRPDRSAILWRLYVERAHRRQGVGRSLVDSLCERICDRVETLYIEYYQQNLRAAAFYTALGFVFDRTETTTFQGTQIVSVFVKRAVVPGV